MMYVCMGVCRQWITEVSERFTIIGELRENNTILNEFGTRDIAWDARGTSFLVREVVWLDVYLSFIDLEREEFDEILPQGMIYPEGAARGIYHPEG